MTADVQNEEGRAKGGRARAARLTPEQRSAAAQKAAAARWAGDVSQAVCGSPDKPLQIGDIEIECYVLEDGTRVLTQRTVLKAMGRHSNVRRIAGPDDDLAPILQGKAIRKYVSEEVREKIKPIDFRTPGNQRALGYNAELLPAICDVYLRAREADDLPSNQAHIAKQAEILVRGLARVGIIALVDEATGYQDLRARDALSRILEAYIATELQQWVSTFPPDFYKEMFRLRDLDFPNGTVRRPQYFGTLTNDIVYKRLAPGVLEELKKVTPRDDKGRTRHRYFQRLTSNVGYPKLREHLGSVVTLMKLSDDWSDFVSKLDRIHPRMGDTMPLPFDEGRGL